MKRVDKPWGHEVIWAVTDRYVGKVLHIKAGQKLSLQYHQKKDETVMVWSGRMQLRALRRGAAAAGSSEMGPGEAFHVTPGLRHRMIASRTPTSSRCRPPSSTTSSASKTPTAARARRRPEAAPKALAVAAPTP